MNEVKETNLTLGPSVKSGARGGIGLSGSDNADYRGDIVIMIQLTSNQSQQWPTSTFKNIYFQYSRLESSCLPRAWAGLQLGCQVFVGIIIIILQ